MNKYFVLAIIVLIAATGGFWWSKQQSNSPTSQDAFEQQEQSLREVQVTIEPGSTFGVLMENAEIGTSVHRKLFAAAEDVYNLADIRAGEDITLFFDPVTHELVQLMYPISTLHELYITREVSEDIIVEKVVDAPEVAIAAVSDVIAESDSVEPDLVEPEKIITWTAEKRAIAYEVTTVHKTGTIDSSLYVAALGQDMDERAIIALANVFQWSIDFAWGTRKGDTFSVLYEERYRNGEYVMPGKILAAQFVNDGDEYFAYYFDATPENKDNEDDGYYDQDGNSVQKMFLKAPLEFKYISSGFTTGARYVSKNLGWTSSHKAIDYAASSGTPVRSVGEGTVTFSGWNGPYGNFITVRHNETYSTNYAHLSKRYVSKGERVRQNETIGLVGSTGFSTGPHLHYEMVKYGTKINPLREVLPPGPSLTSDTKPQFMEHIKQFKGKL